jgi:hypothetical protein
MSQSKAQSVPILHPMGSTLINKILQLRYRIDHNTQYLKMVHALISHSSRSQAMDQQHELLSITSSLSKFRSADAELHRTLPERR